MSRASDLLVDLTLFMISLNRGSVNESPPRHTQGLRDKPLEEERTLEEIQVWDLVAYYARLSDSGESVSVSGDTVVVGAPQEASNATGMNGDQSNNSGGSAGAAYIFDITPDWTDQGCALAGVSGDPLLVGLGTLKPFPFLPPVFVNTSASGTISTPFTMSSGIPAGTELWVQWAISDAAAIHGVALSNAILGVTP